MEEWGLDRFGECGAWEGRCRQDYWESETSYREVLCSLQCDN